MSWTSSALFRDNHEYSLAPYQEHAGSNALITNRIVAALPAPGGHLRRSLSAELVGRRASRLLLQCAMEQGNESVCTMQLELFKARWKMLFTN